MKCRFCNGNLSGPVVDDFFACKICEVHWNIKIPSKAALQQTLAGMMLTACWNSETRKKRLDQASEQLDLIKPLVTMGKFYDVGAAAGFLMHVAQEKGWDVYGNELSKMAVEYAQAHYKINIFHGYVEDDKNAVDNQFDLVVFWNTLEHVRNPIEEITKAKRMLRPDGHIHIEVPLKTSEDLKHFSPAGHMTEFDNKSLDILRDKCGMEEIRNWKVERPGKSRMIRLLWKNKTEG